jgi:thiamine pyrophosphokinase
MSSHHFVREDQEPALLIMDNEGVSFEAVQELLEWSPTVIVAEHVVSQVLLWGIKIDVVVALAENIDELTKTLQDQIPIKFISSNTVDEQLSTALYFLIASKQKAVNIVSNLALQNFETFNSLNISVVRDGKRWSFIQSGHFEKWFPKGVILHVHSANEDSSLSAESDGVLSVQREGNFWVAEE